MVFLRAVVWIAVGALAVVGCGEAPDFSSGHTEGSLSAFFGEPSSCFCQIDLKPSEWRVQYTCSPEEPLDYDLTFYSILPLSANQRGASFTDVQLGRTEWLSSGFGLAAAELEYGSEEFGHPGLDEETQVSKYREVFIWTLDIQAQRICSVLDPASCQDLPAGRAEDLRFTCSVSAF